MHQVSQGRGQDELIRLFFALWPDDAVRQSCRALAQELHRACGGRKVAPSNLHVTLAFIGSIARARMQPLTALAAQIRGRQFSLTLDKAEFWPRNRIVWLGSSSLPAELAALVSELRGALKAQEFPVDARDFFPHMTLLRDGASRERTLPAPPIAWAVTEFVLVESLTVTHAVKYSVLQRWNLN